MPNHVESDLYIEGNKEDLIYFFFYNYYKEKKTFLTFEKYIPYPERFKRLDKEAKEWNKTHSYPDHKTDSYNQGGYEWCRNNWGTKWGIYNVKVIETDINYGCLKYSFESAWSPPKRLIDEIAKRFPNLDTICLTYFESGMGFNGIYSYEKGKLVHNEESKYFGNRGG